jgi:hypothetical protein
VSQKIKKSIKPRKLKKPNRKKPIKILKKSVGLVRFRFYKQKTKKLKSNKKKRRKQLSQTKPKLEKTDPKLRKTNQTGFYPKKPNRTEPKPVGLTRFQFGFVFFKFQFGFFF